MSAGPPALIMGTGGSIFIVGGRRPQGGNCPWVCGSRSSGRVPPQPVLAFVSGRRPNHAGGGATESADGVGSLVVTTLTTTRRRRRRKEGGGGLSGSHLDDVGEPWPTDRDDRVRLLDELLLLFLLKRHVPSAPPARGTAWRSRGSPTTTGGGSGQHRHKR